MLPLEEKKLKSVKREVKRRKRRQAKGGTLAAQKLALEANRYYQNKKKKAITIIDRTKH